MVAPIGKGIKEGGSTGGAGPFHRFFHLFTACWHEKSATLRRPGHDMAGNQVTIGIEGSRAVCCKCGKTEEHLPVYNRGD